MKKSYRMFRRGRTYYCQHNITGKQESLGTKDKAQALQLLHAKNHASEQPMLNMQLARVYASASDPRAADRTWQDVMAEAAKTKTGDTSARWTRAMKEPPFDHIRATPLLETRPDHFLHVLHQGTVSTNIFLRRLHNFALDMDWIPKVIIPRRRWPKIEFDVKRAITWDEHQKVLAGERNPEWRAYYELLWHLGGSQTDVALLTAEDIDWSMRVVTFTRGKTDSPVQLHFGDLLAAILQTLPESGPLFPMISQWHEKDRAKAFIRRRTLVGVKGVTLHSYRYAWAERAKLAGYPAGVRENLRESRQSQAVLSSYSGVRAAS